MATHIYHDESPAGGGGGVGTGLAWEGAWGSGTDYVEYDAVSNNGASYICKGDHKAAAATEPGVGVDWAIVWDLMAASGVDGADVLEPSPSTELSFSGPSATMTAGEALTFGELCYMKSDGKMWKADADAAATMPGVALAGASIDEDATGVFILSGSFVRNDVWNWTVGGLVYAGSGATSTHTAGAMAQAAPNGSGDQVQVVGVATHADRMFFSPSMILLEL